MANKNENASQGMGMALQAGIVLGILSAIIVAISFWVINYWPLPASVAPYFTWREGLVWGGVVGFIFGSMLGFLNDDRHFTVPTDNTY